jgi:predicted transcriptional regulator
MSKVMISVPDTFLKDMDSLARTEQRSRSELVREAIRAYVSVRLGSRPTTRLSKAEHAANRILKSRLSWQEGQTSESLVRKNRDQRSKV